MQKNTLPNISNTLTSITFYSGAVVVIVVSCLTAMLIKNYEFSSDSELIRESTFLSDSPFKVLAVVVFVIALLAGVTLYRTNWIVNASCIVGSALLSFGLILGVSMMFW